MTLGGVGISMVGRNPGSPCVANAMPQPYDGIVVMGRVPVLPAGTTGQANLIPFCVEFIMRIVGSALAISWEIGSFVPIGGSAFGTFSLTEHIASARNPAARIQPSETACATMRPAPRMKIMPARNSRADGPGRPTVKSARMVAMPNRIP